VTEIFRRSSRIGQRSSHPKGQRGREKYTENRCVYLARSDGVYPALVVFIAVRGNLLDEGFVVPLTHKVATASRVCFQLIIIIPSSSILLPAISCEET
jgi:hypothetical protein